MMLPPDEEGAVVGEKRVSEKRHMEPPNMELTLEKNKMDKSNIIFQ